MPPEKFTPGQRQWIEAQLAEPDHAVAVAGAITKTEELAAETDDDGNVVTPARVRFTVTGDNGTATFEAVPPLEPAEREALEAEAAAAAEEAAETAAAEREAELVEAQAAAAEEAKAQRDALVAEVTERVAQGQKAFEERLTKLVDEKVAAAQANRAAK